MADDDAFPRLHPADRALIIDAIGRSIPPGNRDVDSPPTIATGADAALFRKIMREEIDRNKKEIIGPDAETMRNIVRDEIRKDHEAQSTEFQRMITSAVNELRTELFDVFLDLDMPLEKGEHRKETRDKLRDLFSMRQGTKEFRAEIWKNVRNSAIVWLTTAAGGLLAYVGLRGNGGSH